MLSGSFSVHGGFLTFDEGEIKEIEKGHGETMSMMRSFSKTGTRIFSGSCIIANEYGKIQDGYWDNRKIMQHEKELLRCAQHKYCVENVKILILYD